MRNNNKFQRNKDLLAVYDSLITNGNINKKYIKRGSIIDVLYESPAPRFYICPRMAERYVNAYLRGKLTCISRERLAMVEDLVENYKRIRKRRKNEQLCFVWQMVINSPAKGFYLSRQTIMEIIYGYGKYKEKSRSNQ